MGYESPRPLDVTHPRRAIFSRRRVLLSVAVVVFLCAVYMITYTGRVEIADQLQYYSATASVARFGEPVVGLGAWEFMPRSFHPNTSHALRTTIAEPGFIYAAAPFYWLADRIDGLGLAHTTWLFNIFMTAAVCVIMFWYALILGHTERAAVLGALCLGVLTVMWAYSQTFFREQFMMVWLMLTALLLEVWRMTPRRIILLLLAVLSFALAFVSKDAALMAIPGLLMIVLPDAVWQNRARRLVSSVLLGGVLMVPVVLLLMDMRLPEFELARDVAISPEFARVALHTYIMSIGGSFWGTSPIVLLGIPGLVLLMRAGEHRRVWSVVVVLLGYILVYALFRGEEWFGGTIWPQRFLLPVLPFVLLLCLPVLERVAHFRRHRRVWIIGFSLLAIYSLWWQFNAAAFRWYAYGDATYELSAGGLVYWLPGFNDLRYIRPVVLTQLWGKEPLNWAWVRAGSYAVPLIFGALALVSLGLIRAVLRGQRVARAVLLMPALVLIAIFGALRVYHDSDPLYYPDRADFHELVALIRDRVGSGDPVLINDPQYAEFYYNHGKTGGARVVIFPYHPGDRGSCEQPLEITAENPAALLAEQTAPLVYHFAENNPRLWLVMHTGPAVPCVVRPLENFMNKTYYRIAEDNLSPYARLLTYASVTAPDPYAFRGPDYAAQVTFAASNGDRLSITGYSLPRGVVYAPGDVLPVSMQWEVPQTPQVNYTIAWFLVDETGMVVAEGENTWPAAGFAPTSTLQTGLPVWDNRALIIPPDVPAGEYEVWVRMYLFEPESSEISMLNAVGPDVIEDPDGNIGVLPVKIRITPRDATGEDDEG